ncbi:hypothetical protein SAMN02745248_01331 [Hathewaya proteolytica DSM 3090]|uniref:Uncharacterized protein n=2 Tax=Hathewaya proteolytica TaxID=29365 RepID=A0A1M6N9F9_9CLOT|nr:hypothetical protein SAMN02745248_01331 [Hathewaya proteolytica DSM 3090]
MPCKMELKVKDYEKFKAYYCGLCHSIKRQFGNLPRFTLNYDMTFLAVLLDSLSEEKTNYKVIRCAAHPSKKKIIVESNSAIDYAAYCNVMLTYYKLLDDGKDDKNIFKTILSKSLRPYLKKYSDYSIEQYTSEKLTELNKMENPPYDNLNLDVIAEPFAMLTGNLMGCYNIGKEIQANLNFLGYNIGKWIYIIDAYDDLKADMEKNKFNAINVIFNKHNSKYEDFVHDIEGRIDFSLSSCAVNSLNSFKKLPIKKNQDLLYNIIELGLMEKMDNIFKRSESNERSL